MRGKPTRGMTGIQMCHNLAYDAIVQIGRRGQRRMEKQRKMSKTCSTAEDY